MSSATGKDFPVVNGYIIDDVKGQFAQKTFDIAVTKNKLLRNCRLPGTTLLSLKPVNHACYDSVLAVSGRQLLGSYYFTVEAKYKSGGLVLTEYHHLQVYTRRDFSYWRAADVWC
ncbi:hypothetical protein ABPG75_005241 [Micractinium tetrahymenae]